MDRGRTTSQKRAAVDAGITPSQGLHLAGIAVFLANAASDFVTGAAIAVDGGYSVQG
jgi:NAD(P)-dependent dehydrogenase (short-subunit alcohol dehydrogenase family)